MAMIKGMIASGMCAASISVIGKRDDDSTRNLEQRYGVVAERHLALKRLPDADLVILAVKPKDMQMALAEYRNLLPAKGLFISILAGIALRQLRPAVPPGMTVMRAMPNTSVSIGMGVTAITAKPGVTETEWATAASIFKTVGMVERVSEADMDAVTAVSGSGPAYAYLFAEAMEQGAIAAGLSPCMARRLTQQTILGAAQMLQASATAPAELRRQVTSPKGTTQAALDVLQGGKFKELMEQAILAATRRSRELSVSTRESAATN